MNDENFVQYQTINEQGTIVRVTPRKAKKRRSLAERRDFQATRWFNRWFRKSQYICTADN